MYAQQHTYVSQYVRRNRSPTSVQLLSSRRSGNRAVLQDSALDSITAFAKRLLTRIVQVREAMQDTVGGCMRRIITWPGAISASMG